MLKVKRVISAPSTNKKNEFTKLKTEIKNDIKKLVDENQKISKSKDDYVKIIHQIRSEYQRLSLENENLNNILINLKKKKKNRNIGMINIVTHQKNIKITYVKDI